VQLRTDALRARPPGSVRTDVPPSFFFQQLHDNTCDSPPRKATPRAFPYATPPRTHTRDGRGTRSLREKPDPTRRRSETLEDSSFFLGRGKKEQHLFDALLRKPLSSNERGLAGDLRGCRKKKGTQHQSKSVRTHCVLGHPGLSVRTFPLPFTQSQTAPRASFLKEKPTLEPRSTTPLSAHTRGTDVEQGAYEKNQTPHGEGRRSSRTAASFSARPPGKPTGSTKTTGARLLFRPCMLLHARASHHGTSPTPVTPMHSLACSGVSPRNKSPPFGELCRYAGGQGE
jgi:hypothetical protein